MSAPRPVLEKRVLLIQRRATQRQFLLKPCRATEQVIRYALGHNAQIYGIELHFLCVESNHYHLEVTDHFGKISDFLRDFHALVAKLMNSHWKRWENLWAANTQTSIVELLTPDDAFGKGIYTVCNPVKDNLVRLARDWPGVSSIKPEYRNRTITVRRPGWFFDPEGDMPKEVTLRFTPPPGFSHLSDEAWNEKVDAAVADFEDKAARKRAKTNTRILGRKAIRRQSAFARPASHEPRRKMSPRIACKDKNKRIDAIQRHQAWRLAYRQALEAYRAGDKSVVFPFGTHQLRVHTHVKCAAGPGILPIPYALTLRDAH